MQKCASPFVEVRQIEFLARETLTTHCHEPAHISHQWTCESVSGSHLGNEATRENPQRCYDPSDDRDGTAGVPSTQPVLVREPTSAFSVRWGGSYCPLCSTPRNRGAAPRGKHHHTFLESRYRSSDVGRVLTDGRSPSFISAPSGNIAHYTLLRKVVRQARHLCAQSAALMCLMGTPHTPLYARRTVRITGTSGEVPITAQSSTNATDHDALQPLRGSEADCVRSLIRQSIPSRPQHRSKRRAHRARRDGAKPHFR